MPGNTVLLLQVNDARTGGKGVSAEEILNFTQEDLCDDDVMLLDTHTAVAVWVGTSCRENEQRGALALVDEYLASSGRPHDTPVTIVSTRSQSNACPSKLTDHDHVVGLLRGMHIMFAPCRGICHELKG